MYTLRLLGPPLLSGADGPVSGRVAQERKLALLAVLALTEGRTLTRDSLAVLFWPESDQTRARHNVADGVWAARSALGEDAILAQGNRLTLNPEVVATDVEAFEAALASGELARAVELHAGPFMEGFHISGAPGFEDWLDRERSRLTSAHADALEELVRGALEAGRVREGDAWGRRLFAVDRLNSRRALLCMEALAVSGDMAGAIRVGEAHGRELLEELDLPLPAEVEERMRELRASPPPVPAVPPAAAPQSEPAASSSDARWPGPTTPSGAVRGLGPGRWRRPTFLLVGVTVVFLAWMLPGLTNRGTPELVPDRIVVAAFENRSGDPGLDLLGRLAADVLVRGLVSAAVGEVVLPGEMIGTGVGTDDGPRGPRQAEALARELLAGVSVSGTIDSGPEGLVFSTTVTMSPGSRVAFALDPEPVDPTDPGPALDRVRSRVVGTLAAHFGQELPEHPFVVPTPSYESYRTADRATARFLEVRYEEAADLYRRAYEIDTSAVGYLLWEGVSRHNLSDRNSVEAILQELRPRRDELSPFDDAQFEWLEARHLGDLRRALQATRSARAIHPHSGVGGFQVGRELLRSGHPDEALEILLELDPQQGWLSRHRFYWTHVASAYHLLGRHEEELAAAEEGYRQHASSGLLTARLRALAALGRPADVWRVLRESTDPSLHALEAARALRRHGLPGDAVALVKRASVPSLGHEVRPLRRPPGSPSGGIGKPGC